MNRTIAGRSGDALDRNEPAYRQLASAEPADTSDKASPADAERKHAPPTGPPKPGPVVPPAERRRGYVRQPLEAASLPSALLHIKTVEAVTGLSAATIYRKLAQRKFPAPIRLGQRCTRWLSSAVAAWVSAQ